MHLQNPLYWVLKAILGIQAVPNVGMKEKTLKEESAFLMSLVENVLMKNLFLNQIMIIIIMHVH